MSIANGSGGGRVIPVAGIPREMLGFIEANLDSVEQLEILRLLREQPQKEWSAAEIAAESQVQTTAIAAQLACLERRGLLKVFTREADLHCAYGPKTPEIDTSLKHLLQLYNERPVTLITILYARARECDVARLPAIPRRPVHEQKS